MPRRTTSVCAEPGCPTLTDAERCAHHERQRQRDTNRQRASGKRTYDTERWRRRTRRQVLRAEPDCRHCGRPAEHVDHVNGNSHDNRRANLQPLCGPCHSSKTASVDQARDDSGRWTRHDDEPATPTPPRRGSAGSVPLG